jgi:hypothetical protein
LVAQLLIDTETTGLTFHAIGTDATAPSLADTTLGTEFARKAFSLRERAANILSLSVFYLAGEATANITEAGVFGGATASATPDSGTLFSHYLQTFNNSGGDFDLTFEYELEIQ